MSQRFLSVVLLSVAGLVLSATPALAAGSSVSAGFWHSCAVKADGTPVCWGEENAGENSNGQTAIPAGTGSVTQIAAAAYHSCAIKTGGTPVCWGDNGAQQLDVPLGTGSVTRMSGGFTHTCAIKTDDTPVCWGYNIDSQTTIPPGTGTVTQVAAGGNHTCVVKTGGTPVCWGYNEFGQATVPPGTGPVSQITAGLYHTCAIKSDGTPVCWGDNASGKTTVPPDAGTVTRISALGNHTCAIKTDGTPVCWGTNGDGQSTIPPGIGTVTQISAGLNHTCAVKTGGTIVCWGADDTGQLGAAPAITSPPLRATGENHPYAFTVTATGTPTPTFAVTSGALPPGLALDPSSGEITGTPTTSGTFTGTISASDGVFADATQSFSIAVDVDKPSTTDDVPAGFVNHAVTVTLAADDTGGTGVGHTYYTTDGSDPTTGSSTYSASTKPVLGDGQSVKYFSVDNAGNQEAIKTSPVAHVDVDKPSTTDDVPAGFVDHQVVVTLTATDTGSSGAARVYYTTDGSVPTVLSATYDAGSKPVLANGEQIKYFATDNAGNEEVFKTSGMAQVDVDKPTTSIISPANGATYAHGAVVAAAYSCADGASGVSACTGPVAKGAPIDTQTPGQYTFTVSAQDTAGNVTATTVSYRVNAPPVQNGGGGGGGTTTLPPPDTTGPVIVIPAKNKTLTARSGAVLFGFGPALEDTTGTMSLKSGGALGSARINAARGKAVVVRIKLSAKAKKTLAKRRKLKVQATITMRDAAGNATVKLYTFTLKAAKA